MNILFFFVWYEQVSTFAVKILLMLKLQESDI